MSPTLELLIILLLQLTMSLAWIVDKIAWCPPSHVISLKWAHQMPKGWVNSGLPIFSSTLWDPPILGVAACETFFQSLPLSTVNPGSDLSFCGLPALTFPIAPAKPAILSKSLVQFPESSKMVERMVASGDIRGTWFMSLLIVDGGLHNATVLLWRPYQHCGGTRE
ncbi:hypothetical protein DFH07DRAFT_764451 [Mycena maculata]|uniref:Uncharacterized protein n=1 Tax=Mycena maculata TaxID=230809 RepID=A0AAD7NZK2_9AGAR|nr:hypothetical protein DFH07DRAFT_764451 [Mycena maculata]